MSEMPCTKCGTPTVQRQQDGISGRIVPVCEKCGQSSSRRLLFMLFALTVMSVCLMQNL